MSKTPFIHLHTHSHYSLLDGLSKVDRLVDLAKEYEMPALALTDHGNMYGAIEFYKKCKAADIKPIIGVEAYIANRTRFDKDPQIDNKRYHLTLLAKNEAGYKNLMKLVSKSYLEGYYYKPRMDHDLLREHSEGIICLSGCFGGEFQKALRAGNPNEAERVALMYQEIFGADNFFLEVMHHPGIEGLLKAKEATIEMAGRLKIPLVGTQDSHYPCDDDKVAHETLLNINTDATSSDANRFSFGVDNFNFIGTKEAYAKFGEGNGAVEHTKDIADMVNINIPLGQWIFPEFIVESGLSHKEELRKLTYEGLKYRNMQETAEIKERIERELEIIGIKNFEPFYLVTIDIMRHSREIGVYYTVRGSGAGSIVAYLTGITNVDPMEFVLPFERFLNPYRPSPPDFDMDFADDRRDELKEYVRQKYGDDRVAEIGTFGKMLARAVVRDVARSLGKPYEVGDKIAKLIPMGAQGFPMTIDRALDEEPDLKKLYDSDKETQEILKLGRKLEGSARHVGVHAAGVVIAPDDLMNYVPLQIDSRTGKKITQYDMYSLDPNAGGPEVVGLLKFDFLGIKNLGILADAVKRVKTLRNVDIDIEAIPFDDKKTFEMLARGETEATFQLSGGGMTQFLVDLKPATIHDINSMVALYRPGPMKNIPDYIERRHGRQKVTYLHPKMEKFLGNSYGILVYQEDIMYTALEVSNYTWETVDKLRKAIGKKKREEMAIQHDIFVNGCAEKSNMEKKDAEALWDLFEPFQGYGFNRAHAACYGRVAYQTAYMKANYPVEYMAAVLTADSGDVDRVATMIHECKRMSIEVLPPDVNESIRVFAVGTDDDINEETGYGNVIKKIRFGLNSIKNFGGEIGKAIRDERRVNGKYRDYSDFLSRVLHKNLNKKSLEALIMCGALDSLGEGRNAMLQSMDEALAFNRAIAKESNSDQASLFGDMKMDEVKPVFTVPGAEPLSRKEKLKWEKELLGLYISGHPLEEHKDKLERASIDIKKARELGDRTPVVLAGLFEVVKELTTKKGEHMMFGKLEDFSESIELVIFPGTYAEIKDLLVPDTCLVLKGSVSHRNGNPSIIVEKVKAL